MKNKIKIAILALIGLSVLTGYYYFENYKHPPYVITGFVIEDDFGEMIEYSVKDLDNVPCEHFLEIWQEAWGHITKNPEIHEKFKDCVKSKDGYSFSNPIIPKSYLIFE